MATTRTTGIIYLNKNYFDIYITGMANALRYTFAPQIIQDMDIVSRDLFTQQLDTFLQTNKLPPATILILLADPLLFCKELPPGSDVNAAQSEELRAFLDAVPFEHVVSKLYKLEKKEILVASNKEFQEIFQSVFSKKNSHIDSVVPLFLLGKTIDLSQGMPKQQAKIIIEKLGNIKPWTMPVMQDVIASPQELPAMKEQTDANELDDTPTPTPSRPRKKSSKRAALMAVMFIPLVGVMGFMYMQMNAENAKDAAIVQAKRLAQTNQNTSTNTPAPTAETALAPTPLTGAFSATAEEQNLLVTIQYSATSASVAASIKDELTQFGIKNITNTQTASSNTTQNSISFGAKVLAATKQRLLDEVHKVIADVQTQVNSQLSTDILITLP